VSLRLFIGQFQTLRERTELLEALEWDEELLSEFLNELQAMLAAAPPDIGKALFWLKSTGWECFNGNLMPENVFRTIEILINNARKQMLTEEAARKRYFSSGGGGFYRDDEDDKWN
jgi:hypothetical protein